MPTDSIKNIERAFTGRIPLIILDNDTPPNEVITLIDYGEVLNKHKPSTAVNITLSVALEQLQLISYLPGLFKPSRLPEYDEDLTPLLKQQKEDIEWLAEFNPSTQMAVEVTLFEKFNNSDPWLSIARKWLYNQEIEYYLDLINPFLNSQKTADIGDINYKLGIAITRKPETQTVKAANNYIRIRGAYSGIITYEQQEPVKRLDKTTSNRLLDINSPHQVFGQNSKRKLFYLQNTGKSIVYFNFDSDLINNFSPFLLPGETLTFEGGIFKYSGNNKEFFPPLAEYLINDGLWVLTEGKDFEGKAVNKHSISWIDFYEV